MLRRNFLRYGDKRVAERKKNFGIWEEYSWKDVYERSKCFSLGLVSMGLVRGDRVAMIGNNDPQLFWAEWATQAAGGTSISIYPDCLPPEIKYYMQHSEAKFFIAEDQEQVDKILSILPECPSVTKVIYWDSKGLSFYDEPVLTSFEQVENMGREYEREHPTLFEDSITQGKGGDVACFSYTSGTTGLPKAAMLTHSNIIFFSRCVRTAIPMYEKDQYVSYISPAWATEQFLGITSGLDVPLVVNFPEESETVMDDVRDIGPDLLFYVPRLWEDLASLVRMKIDDTSWLKRKLYSLGLSVGFKAVHFVEQRKPIPWYWRALHKLADIVVLRAARDQIGLARARSCFTAAMAASPDLVQFFWALGAKMKNIYGSTECGLVSAPIEADFKFESVGKLLPAQEMKVVDGEIFVKGPGVFAGYWKNEEAYNNKVKDGWYQTGDSGWVDDDGHLIYWDRVEELIPLADGTKFAPQFAEVRLRFSPFLKDAMVIGGEGRGYVTAIIDMDFRNVGKWAESHRIPYTTFTDLSQKPEVLELVMKDVERVNRLLPEVARVKRFVNLHKEFDADEAELTRTRKLKRAVMEKTYSDIINGMYGDQESVKVESSITYQDGKKGVVRTEIQVIRMQEE
ncbi:MAG: AMP-binding protein [Dehalococcoidia bacterium]|jgi:long-chain acyl-CoA synthetase|nr:AMP-binding protein [Dehalococcoidia bacterium]